MITSYHAAPEVEVLTTNFPIPGFGQIPINSFVLHGDEPLLVDAGPGVERDSYMEALRSIIDPADLKWIWLTHTDGDHTGALHQLLDECPELTVITTFLGVGIMSVSDPLPMDRVLLLNPGQSITIGKRTLTAFKPPTFDNPATTGFFDSASGLLVSADCFGALLEDVPQHAADLSEAELHDAQVLWATIDSPWLQTTDRSALARALDAVTKLAPTLILSSHLPAAPGSMLQRLLAAVAAVPEAGPFEGPDQAALELMMSEMVAAAQ